MRDKELQGEWNDSVGAVKHPAWAEFGSTLLLF